jgi:hypothetical protein
LHPDKDRPAAESADLGVAMGAKGAAAPAEAADVVLLVDQLDRILPAMEIARRSRSIALQSVYAGMGLSVAGMIAAALGAITPVQGAVLQELLDIAVILNALRSLRDRPWMGGRRGQAGIATDPVSMRARRTRHRTSVPFPMFVIISQHPLLRTGTKGH